MQYFIQGLLQRRWSVIVASLLLTGAACLKRQASEMPTTTLVSYPAAPRINGETFFSTAYDQFNPELRAAHHPNYTVLGIDLTQYGYAGLNLSSRQLTNAEMTHDVNDSSHAFIALEEGLNYPQWQPPASSLKGGYQQLYVERVMQANTGADLDFLTGCRGDDVPRESH